MERTEAIKIIKTATVYTPEEMEALETLIPELKESEESEEERVRKDIIGLIKFALNDGSAVSPGSHTTKEEALAYLEKQKDHFRDDTKMVEQKPAEWSEDWREEDIQTRFAFYTYKDEDGVLYLSNVFVEEASRNHGFGTKILAAAEKVAETIGATTISLKVKQDSPANAWYRKNGYGYVAFEDGYDWLEKNLEYMKPNKQEWSEEDIEMYINVASSLRGYACGLEDEKHRAHIKKELDWFENRFKSLCLQQKPEWSEEDKKMINTLVDYVECPSCWNLKCPKEKLVAFIKSLPERLNLQPNCPQNKIHYWTEEEIEPIVSDYLTGREHYGGMMARLRCLKPKSHWKPSEEQMKHLERCFSHRHTSQLPNQHVLESLYHDLQKLLQP